MNKNHGVNVTLTPEQSFQLEEWKARLAVVQDEIHKANEILSALNANIDVLNKSKVYLDETIEGLRGDLKRLDTAKETLRVEVSHSAALLAEHVAQTTSHITHLRSKEKDHGEREDLLAKKEKELAKKQEDYDAQEKKLAVQRLSVEKAREAFSEAAKHVGW